MATTTCRIATVFIFLALRAGVAEAQPPGRLDRDVHKAIARGLSWLKSNHYFDIDQNGNAEAGEATPLVTLALLEKPVTAGGRAQGYRAARAADRRSIAMLIDATIRRRTLGFMAYRNGPEMMALSLYLRTGGTDPRARVALAQAVDEALDAIGQTEPEPRGASPCKKKRQPDGTLACPPLFRMPTPAGIEAWHGYWGYSGVDGQDSSTTQFVVAGLGAARGVYASSLFADSGRLGLVTAVLARTRQAYEAHGLHGEACSPGGALSPTERGHGYNYGIGSPCEAFQYTSQNSAQQTASGLWIQLLGGADLNQPGVQGYLEWLRNRYAYTTSAGQPFSSVSYGYYLWSSAKAYLLLERAGIRPEAWSLTTRDLGLLTPAESPAYVFRENHLNPRDVPRPEAFGSGPSGYYADPGVSASWYFDYAYTLLSRQDPDGWFKRPNGAWEHLSEQAYYILILERSLGGADTAAPTGSEDGRSSDEDSRSSDEDSRDD
jgi:hypothetical protein